MAPNSTHEHACALGRSRRLHMHCSCPPPASYRCTADAYLSRVRGRTSAADVGGCGHERCLTATSCHSCCCSATPICFQADGHVGPGGWTAVVGAGRSSGATWRSAARVTGVCVHVCVCVCATHAFSCSPTSHLLRCDKMQRRGGL